MQKIVRREAGTRRGEAATDGDTRLGGSITPAETTLETSLTVDEAEGILSRLASRGHLTMERKDGALSYDLTSRRSRV